VNWLNSPESFQSFKLEVIAATGLAKDALHVHIGLLIFIAVRLVWRKKGGWFFAWLVALGAALAGEYLDIRAEKGNLIQSPDPAHWHDIWNTMFWPTILLVIGQWLEPRRNNSEAPKNIDTSSDLPDQPLK
jgi:hypothetical protein